MKEKVADNLGKFFYDCGKVSFAVLVIGVLAKKPFLLPEFLLGILVTLSLLGTGVIIDATKEE
ncbi:MAG: hypothetical protein HYZ95_01915 [Candidatus Omnitrophica bacterium]|nr:hypothetical protein [Candidatus Omnitrophota bacterium]